MFKVNPSYHLDISNESAWKTRHKTRYNTESQGRGKSIVDIQFFVSGVAYFKKKLHDNIGL